MHSSQEIPPKGYLQEKHILLEALLIQEKVASLRINPQYMETVQRGNFDSLMREKLVMWMLELSGHLNFFVKTKNLAIMILDLTLSQQEIPLESIQLLGIMCLFLAQKLEEHTSLNYEKLQALCDNQYSLSQISFMELFICLYCSLLLEESLHEEVLRELEDHLYLCFTESRFLLYSQSVISLSCLMHYFLNMNFNEGIEAIRELLGIYREVINYEKVVECCGILTNLLENGENTEGFLTPKRGIIEEIIEPSTATSVNYEETTENFEGRTLAKFF